MKKVTFILTGLLFLMISCIKDLDLDQVENLNLKPALLTPLINVKLNSKDFVNGIDEKNIFYKKTTFEFLNNDLGKNNVKRIKLKHNISNEIKREFTYTIRFLAQDSSIIHSESYIIAPEENLTEKEVTISLMIKPNFKNIKFVELNLVMKGSADGSILDTDDPSKLEINLSAILYSKI